SLCNQQQRESRGCSRRRRRCYRCRRRRVVVAETRQQRGRARECGGPVRQRQLSRRRPPSFPCSERVARRSLGTQLSVERAHLFGGLRELALETAGLPNLELVA